MYGSQSFFKKSAFCPTKIDNFNKLSTAILTLPRYELLIVLKIRMSITMQYFILLAKWINEINIRLTLIPH